MRTIRHTVRCSGELHEVWRDTEGCLHRTCNGEGCTLGFEKAWAALAGRPDMPAGRSHYRARYSASGWSEDWKDAKRNAWKRRAERHSARGEKCPRYGTPAYAAADKGTVGVSVEFFSDDDDLAQVLDAIPTALPAPDATPPTSQKALARIQRNQHASRIAAELEAATLAEIGLTTYRRPKSKCMNTTLHTDLVFLPNNPAPAAVISSQHQIEQRTKSGRHLTATYGKLLYATNISELLQLRIALGGTALFHNGEEVLLAAKVLERRSEGIVVAAGKQAAGVRIECAPALVSRSGLRATLIRWLAWSELSDQAVSPYGAYLAHSHSAAMRLRAVCARATQGHPRWEELRRTRANSTRRSVELAQREVDEALATIKKLPKLEVLQSTALTAAHAARAYATQWGDLVGCPKTCSVLTAPIEEVTGNSPFFEHCPARINTQFDEDGCIAIKELTACLRAKRVLLQARKDQRAWRKQLREEQTELASYGFAVDESGQLVEIVA